MCHTSMLSFAGLKVSSVRAPCPSGTHSGGRCRISRLRVMPAQPVGGRRTKLTWWSPKLHAAIPASTQKDRKSYLVIPYVAPGQKGKPDLKGIDGRKKTRYGPAFPEGEAYDT